MDPFRVNSKSILLGKAGQMDPMVNREQQVLMEGPALTHHPVFSIANEARSEERMVSQVALVPPDLPVAVAVMVVPSLYMPGIPPRLDRPSTSWLLEGQVAKVAKVGRVGKAVGEVAVAARAASARVVRPTELMALKGQQGLTVKTARLGKRDV
jgi:hypothetical protein